MNKKGGQCISLGFCNNQGKCRINAARCPSENRTRSSVCFLFLFDKRVLPSFLDCFPRKGVGQTALGCTSSLCVPGIRTSPPVVKERRGSFGFSNASSGNEGHTLLLCSGFLALWTCVVTEIYGRLSMHLWSKTKVKTANTNFITVMDVKMNLWTSL